MKDRSKKTQEPEDSQSSLDAEISNLEKEMAVFSSTINTVENDAPRLIKEFNRTLGAFGRDLKTSLSQSARSLRFYFLALLVFWVLGAIAVGYVSWQISAELGEAFAGIWLAVGAFVLWNARNQRRYLEASEVSLSDTLPEPYLGGGDANAVSKLPQSFSLTQTMGKTIQDSLTTIADTAIHLIPKLSDMVELRTRRLKQEHFIDEFSFALSRYRAKPERSTEPASSRFLNYSLPSKSIRWKG